MHRRTVPDLAHIRDPLLQSRGRVNHAEPRGEDRRVHTDLLRHSVAILDAPSLAKVAARAADAACALCHVAMAAVVVEPADDSAERAPRPSAPSHDSDDSEPLVLPLVGRDGRAVGMLRAWPRPDCDLAPYDRETLVFLARLVGLAVEAARADDEPRQLGRIARMMHDLRTPLAAMLAWTWALKRGLDAVRTRRALDGIERSARAQATLLEQAASIVRTAPATRIEPPRRGSDGRAAADGRARVVSMNDHPRRAQAERPTHDP